jgi:hypothetical protein
LLFSNQAHTSHDPRSGGKTALVMQLLQVTATASSSSSIDWQEISWKDEDELMTSTCVQHCVYLPGRAFFELYLACGNDVRCETKPLNRYVLLPLRRRRQRACCVFEVLNSS